MLEQNDFSITLSKQTKQEVDKKKKLSTFIENTSDLATLIPINRIPNSQQSNESSDIDFNVTIEKVVTPVVEDAPDSSAPPSSLGDSSSTIGGDKEKEQKDDSSSDDDQNKTDYEKMVDIVLFNSKELTTVSRSKPLKSSLTSAMLNFVTGKEKNQSYRYGPRPPRNRKSYSTNPLITPAHVENSSTLSSSSETRTVDKNTPNTTVVSLSTIENVRTSLQNPETDLSQSSSQVTSNVVESCHKTMPKGSDKSETCQTSQVTSSVYGAASKDDESPDTTDVSNDSESNTVDSASIVSLALKFPVVAVNPSSVSTSTDQAKSSTSKSTENSEKTLKNTEQIASTRRTSKSTDQAKSSTSKIMENSPNRSSKSTEQVTGRTSKSTENSERTSKSTENSKRSLKSTENSSNLSDEDDLQVIEPEITTFVQNTCDVSNFVSKNAMNSQEDSENKVNQCNRSRRAQTLASLYPNYGNGQPKNYTQRTMYTKNDHSPTAVFSKILDSSQSPGLASIEKRSISPGLASIEKRSNPGLVSISCRNPGLISIEQRSNSPARVSLEERSNSPVLESSECVLPENSLVSISPIRIDPKSSNSSISSNNSNHNKISNTSNLSNNFNSSNTNNPSSCLVINEHSLPRSIRNNKKSTENATGKVSTAGTYYPVMSEISSKICTIPPKPPNDDIRTTSPRVKRTRSNNSSPRVKRTRSNKSSPIVQVVKPLQNIASRATVVNAASVANTGNVNAASVVNTGNVVNAASVVNTGNVVNAASVVNIGNVVNAASVVNTGNVVIAPSVVNTGNVFNTASVNNFQNILPGPVISSGQLVNILPSNIATTVNNNNDLPPFLIYNNDKLAPYSIYNNNNPAPYNISILPLPGAAPLNIGPRLTSSPSSNGSILSPAPVGNNTTNTYATNCSLNMNPVGPRPTSPPRSNVSIITPAPVGNNTTNKTSLPYATNCSPVSTLGHIVPEPSEGHSPASDKLIGVASKSGDSGKGRLSTSNESQKFFTPNHTDGKLVRIAPKPPAPPVSKPNQILLSVFLSVPSLLKSLPSNVIAQLNLVMSDKVNPGASVRDLIDCLIRLSECLGQSKQLTSQQKSHGQMMLRTAQKKLDDTGMDICLTSAQTESFDKDTCLTLEQAQLFKSQLLYFFRDFCVHRISTNDSILTVSASLMRLIKDLGSIKVPKTIVGIKDLKIFLQSFLKSLSYKKELSEEEESCVVNLVKQMMSTFQCVEDCYDNRKRDAFAQNMGTLLSIIRTHNNELKTQLLRLKVLGTSLVKSEVPAIQIHNYLKELWSWCVQNQKKLTYFQKQSGQLIMKEMVSHMLEKTFQKTLFLDKLNNFFKLFDLDKIKEHGSSNKHLKSKNTNASHTKPSTSTAAVNMLTPRKVGNTNTVEIDISDSDVVEIISPHQEDRNVNLGKSTVSTSDVVEIISLHQEDRNVILRKSTVSTSFDPVNVKSYTNKKTTRRPPPLIKIGNHQPPVPSLSPIVHVLSPNNSSAIASQFHNESHNVATNSLYSVASLSPVSSRNTGAFSVNNHLIDTTVSSNNGQTIARISPCKTSHTLTGGTQDDDPFIPLILDIHSEEEEDLTDNKHNMNTTDNEFSPVISSVSSLTENRADLLLRADVLLEQTTLVITNEGCQTVPTNTLKKTSIQEYLDSQQESQNDWPSSEFSSLKTESQLLFVGTGQPPLRRVKTYLEKLFKFIGDHPKEVMGFQKSYGECFIGDMLSSFDVSADLLNRPVEFETATTIKSDLRAFFTNDFDDHAFTYFEASMGFPLEMCIICMEMKRKKKLLFLKFLNHFVVDHVETFPDSKKYEYYERIEMTLDKMKRTFRYMRSFGNCLLSFNVQKWIQDHKQRALKKAVEFENGKKINVRSKSGKCKKNTSNKSPTKEKTDKANVKKNRALIEGRAQASPTKEKTDQANVKENAQASPTKEKTDQANVKENRAIEEERAQARARLKQVILKQRDEIKKGIKVNTPSWAYTNFRKTEESKTNQSKSETEESLDEEIKIHYEKTELNAKESNSEENIEAEVVSEIHEVRTDIETKRNTEICATKAFSIHEPIKQKIKDEVESTNIAVKEEYNKSIVDNSDQDDDGGTLLKIYEEIDLISVHDSDADTPDELDEDTDEFLDKTDQELETDEFVDRTDEEPITQDEQRKSDNEDEEVTELNQCEKSQEIKQIRVQSIKDEVVDKIIEQKVAEKTTRRLRVRKRKKPKKDDNYTSDEESEKEFVDSRKKKKKISNSDDKNNKEVEKRIMDILAAARKEMEQEEERLKEIEQLENVQIPSKTYEKKKPDDDCSVRIPSKSYEKKPQKAIKTYSKKEPVSNILYSAYVSMIRMVTLDKEIVNNSKTNKSPSNKQEVESIKLFEYFDNEFIENIVNTEDGFGVESTKSEDGIDLYTIDQFDPDDLLFLETEPLSETFGIFPKVNDEKSRNANFYSSQLYANVFVKTEIEEVEEDISQSSSNQMIETTVEETGPKAVEKITSEFDKMFDPSAKYNDDSYCQILSVSKRKSVENFPPTDSNCENANIASVKYPEFDNKRRKFEPKTENTDILCCQDKDKESSDKNELIELDIKEEEIEDPFHVETEQTRTKDKRSNSVLNSKSLPCQDNALERSRNKLIELEEVKEEKIDEICDIQTDQTTSQEEICHIETNYQTTTREKTSNSFVSFHAVECEQFVFKIVEEEFPEDVVEISDEDLNMESDLLIIKEKILESSNSTEKFSQINDESDFCDDNEPIMLDINEDTNETIMNNTEVNDIRNELVHSTEDKIEINGIKNEIVPMIEDYTVSIPHSAESSMKLPLTLESFVRIYNFVSVYCSLQRFNHSSVPYLMSLFQSNQENRPIDCLILELILKEVTKRNHENLFLRAKKFLETNFAVENMYAPKLPQPKKFKITNRFRQIITELNLTEREFEHMRNCKVVLNRFSTELVENKSIQMSSELVLNLMESENQRKSHKLLVKTFGRLLKK